MKFSQGTTLQSGVYIVDNFLRSSEAVEIYLGHNAASNEKIMIHRLLDSLSGYSDIFLEKARAYAQAPESAFVRLIDAFIEGDDACLITGDISGTPLGRQFPGQTDETTARRIIASLANSVNILHRLGYPVLSLSPESVYINVDGQPVITEFSLPIPLISENSTTNTYAARERYGATGRNNPTHDLYSLGAIYYRLITGQTPPEVSIIQERGLEYPPEVSDETADIIDKALDPRPANRFSSADEFIAAISGNTGSTGSMLSYYSHAAEPAPAPEPLPKADVPVDVTPTPVAEEPKTIENKPKPQPIPEPHPTGNAVTPQPVATPPVPPTPPAPPAPAAPAAPAAPQSRQAPEPEPEPEITAAPPAKTKKSSGLRSLIAIGGLVVVGIIAGVAYVFWPDSATSTASSDLAAPVLPDTPENDTLTDSLLTVGVSKFLYTGPVNASGLPEGQGLAKYQGGQWQSYEGEWTEGIWNGSGKLIYTNGDIFEGTFVEGTFAEGKYLIQPDQTGKGSYFSGTFKNGTPFEGSWYQPDGKAFQKVSGGNTTFL